MDQLKIALEHKFWILAGLAVLLPPIGWWAATGKLAKDTEERNRAIATAEKKIPEKPDTLPNDKWIKGGQQIAAELTGLVAQSEQQLYEHQVSAMTFPEVVKNALDKCHVKYRGPIGTTPDSIAARDFFAQSYEEDWQKTVEIVKPYRITTGEGLVLLPDAQDRDSVGLTKHSEVKQWRQTLFFTDVQFWDVQEDIWFLRSLLQAVARVNEGATEIGNARIKKLNEVILRGGSSSDLANRRAGKSTTSSPGAAAQQPSGRMQLGGLHGAGGPESSYAPPKAFDADDVFGDDGTKSGTDRRAKETATTTSEGARWAENGTTWYKRGFVMRVVMDEREIPTLLAELTKSPFPVEILHVEHSVFRLTGSVIRSTPGAQTAVNANGETTEASKEQQAQRQRFTESLGMAFNMHYLANVIVAGTLTIYREPTAPAAGSSPGTPSAPAQAAPPKQVAVSGPPKATAPDAKTARPGEAGKAPLAPAATAAPRPAPGPAAARPASGPAAANSASGPGAAGSAATKVEAAKPVTAFPQAGAPKAPPAGQPAAPQSNAPASPSANK